MSEKDDIIKNWKTQAAIQQKHPFPDWVQQDIIFGIEKCSLSEKPTIAAYRIVSMIDEETAKIRLMNTKQKSLYKNVQTTLQEKQIGFSFFWTLDNALSAYFYPKEDKYITVYDMCLNFELKLGHKTINDITAACGFSEKLVSSATMNMKQTVTFIPTKENIQTYEKTIKENYNSDKFTCESCHFIGYEYLIPKQIKTDADTHPSV